MKGFSRCLIAALAWGALTGGARYPWAYWPLAVVCAVLGVWALVHRRGWARADVPWLAAGLIAVTAAIALQAVPLPRGVFTSLTPAADRFLDQYQVGYMLAPSATHSLSVDAEATLTALAIWIALAVLVLGLAATLGEIRLDMFAARLAAIGVLLAVIGVVQRTAMGVEPYVYGLWKAPPLSTPFGPFLNRNHFAGWMVMAAPVVLGYACAALEAASGFRRQSAGAWIRWTFTPEASRFLVAAFAVLAMSTALVVTGSRSGITSFALAVVVFGALLGRRVGAKAGRRVAGVALVGLVLGAVVWAGTHSTIARFSVVSADLPGRFSAWRDTLHVASDFPIVGTGLGTFLPVMIVYQTGSRISIFAQAHNDYLQLMAEGGLLVCLPALALVAVIVRTTRRRLRDSAAAMRSEGAADGSRRLGPREWVRLGAVAGLVGIAAQSTVEYSLQRPGNAALCVVLLGLALHRPLRRTGAYADRV